MLLVAAGWEVLGLPHILLLLLLLRLHFFQLDITFPYCHNLVRPYKVTRFGEFLLPLLLMCWCCCSCCCSCFCFCCCCCCYGNLSNKGLIRLFFSFLQQPLWRGAWNRWRRATVQRCYPPSELRHGRPKPSQVFTELTPQLVDLLLKPINVAPEAVNLKGEIRLPQVSLPRTRPAAGPGHLCSACDKGAAAYPSCCHLQGTPCGAKQCLRRGQLRGLSDRSAACAARWARYNIIFIKIELE